MGHKAFSESEQEELANSEEVLDFDKIPRKRTEQKSSHILLAGWPGVLIGMGIGVALTAGGMRMLSHPKSSTEVKPNQSRLAGQSVTVTQVRNTPITRTIEVTGTVAARGDLIPVLPQTTGLRIEQVLVQEGDTVQSKEVMAVLDNSVLKAELDQANAQLESAQAIVGQRKAAAAQAQATSREAQQALQRYQILAKSGAISRQDLSTRVTTAITDQEAFRVAQANINGAQADVRNNAAHVRQLRTQLAQTIVRAPVSGMVAEKIARVGDVTNGTQKLFSIIQDKLLEVQAQISATELPQVRINAPALITSDADSQVHLRGRVREIAPLVDPQSRQATVKIDVPLTSLLRPGLFVQVAITTNTVTGLTVPAQSVVSPTIGGHVVFLLSGDGKVHAQSVQVGELIQGNRIEIKQGLNVGDRIVVSGAGFLNDGDFVQVNPPPVKPTSH